MCISFVKGWRKGQNQEVKKPSVTGRSCWEKKKLEENIGSEITVIRQENKMFLHKKKNSSNIIIACLSCCELKLTSSADEPPEEN